jgi:hypothetical protein
MKIRNQNLTILGDKFSGKMNEAFKKSSINKIYSNLDIERLITYNEILGEFINLGYGDLYDEFEYRICYSECPNIVLVSLMNRNEEVESTMGYLLNKINYFIDKDFMILFE